MLRQGRHLSASKRPPNTPLPQAYLYLAPREKAAQISNNQRLTPWITPDTVDHPTVDHPNNQRLTPWITTNNQRLTPWITNIPNCIGSNSGFSDTPQLAAGYFILTGVSQRREWIAQITVTEPAHVNIDNTELEVLRIRNSQRSGDGVPVTINYSYSSATKCIVKFAFFGRSGTGSGGKSDIDLLKFIPAQ